MVLLEVDLEAKSQHVVVNSRLSGRSSDLGVVFGRLSCRIFADIELALTVSVTVVVVELVVQLHLDILVHPVVETKGVSLSRSTIDSAEIKVASLVTGAEFDVAPVVGALHLGVLATH